MILLSGDRYNELLLAELELNQLKDSGLESTEFYAETMDGFGERKEELLHDEDRT